MAWNLRTAVLVGTILLPLLAASGCTGTDVITAGNGSVRFDVTLTNVNNAARFEILRFTVTQIALRPADPDASAVLGPLDLALLTGSLTVDTTGQFFGSKDVPIPAGNYVLEAFTLNAVTATDNDGTGSPATCAEWMDVFPSTSPLPGAFTYFDGTDLDVVLTMDPNTANVINLTVDVDVFIEELAEAWRCRPRSTCLPDPWCLGSSFVSSTFKRNVDSYFSFD